MGALLLVLAACALPVEPTPVPGFETPDTPTGNGAGRAQDALIDAVRLSPEPPYTLEIEGQFRDGCTELDAVTQAVEGDRIVVSVYTLRDPEAFCTQALVPFTHTLALDVAGLALGAYTVDVQGATATLQLGAAEEPQDEEMVVAQDALIDAVRVSPDAPYRLEIEGQFRDGCTELDSVVQTVEQGRIVVTVYTVRPQDALCTEALVPFAHTMPLDVAGLEPGEYTVDVQGVTTTLNLSEEATAPPEPGRAAIRQGNLPVRQGVVEGFDILFLESYPVQINVVIQGHMADGCTRLSEIVQVVQGRTIQFIVYTERPRDAICTLALVPYRETVRLDTRGLALGEYTVEIHGLTQELALDESMIVAAEGSDVCPAPQEGQRQLINIADGYCLAYPEIYTGRILAPGALLITAMERSDLPEARIVSLLIEQMGPVNGRDLETLAEEQWGTLTSRGIRLTRSEAQFGDAPVLVADGIPGRMVGRQALVSDGESYFLLTLTPIDRGYARQTAYAEELWEDIAASWRFYR
jgi:inhibitor of cysteine peptidase